MCSGQAGVHFGECVLVTMVMGTIQGWEPNLTLSDGGDLGDGLGAAWGGQSIQGVLPTQAGGGC